MLKFYIFKFKSEKITLNLLIKRTFYEQRNSRFLLEILEFLRAFLFINSRNSRILLGILDFICFFLYKTRLKSSPRNEA